MSMKVPAIVKEAQQALQDGFCVVIGLQSTGEVCFICPLENVVFFLLFISPFAKEYLINVLYFTVVHPVLLLSMFLTAAFHLYYKTV